ncbi:MAG: hypothetical protein JKY61_13010 [Planctomycetes bacterium]|nr:hypothetical protein [Planctomycetota bacterium]
MTTSDSTYKQQQEVIARLLKRLERVEERTEELNDETLVDVSSLKALEKRVGELERNHTNGLFATNERLYQLEALEAAPRAAGEVGSGALVDKIRAVHWRAFDRSSPEPANEILQLFNDHLAAQPEPTSEPYVLGDGARLVIEDALRHNSGESTHVMVHEILGALKAHIALEQGGGE